MGRRTRSSCCCPRFGASLCGLLITPSLGCFQNASIPNGAGHFNTKGEEVEGGTELMGGQVRFRTLARPDLSQQPVTR